MRTIVSSAPATADGMFDALVAVYAWGWSMTPVGVTRAATVLQADRESVGTRLLAARSQLLAQGPQWGYRALAGKSRIAGLGPSFGTKFLYFASTDTARALILDRLVCDWLRQHVGRAFPSTRWSPKAYQRYLALMAKWGAELEIEAHVLEEIVFTSEANRRGLSGWGQETIVGR